MLFLLFTVNDLKSQNIQEVLNDPVLFDTERWPARKNINQADIGKSKKYYNTAVELYKNKKDYAQSFLYFVRAIQLYPDVAYYYEFGNNLMDLKEYSSAKKAFIISLTGLDKTDLSAYNIACIDSLMQNYVDSKHYLELAISEDHRR